MNKLVKTISKRPIDFIFSLFCGLAYFFIAFDFVKTFTKNGGTMLAFFFCPVIICGMALVILKSMRQWVEDGNDKKIRRTILLHIILFLVSIIFLVDAILK